MTKEPAAQLAARLELRAVFAVMLSIANIANLFTNIAIIYYNIAYIVTTGANVTNITNIANIANTVTLLDVLANIAYTLRVFLEERSHCFDLSIRGCREELLVHL